MVRSVAMFYSQHKKGIENKLRNELKSERVRLEVVIECSPDENNIQVLRIINSRKRDLEMKSIEGHRIRARLPNFEDGEPNISFYAKMENIEQSEIQLTLNLTPFMMRRVIFRQVQKMCSE